MTEVKLMTELLEKAIAEVRKLPEGGQDAIAALILDELASEKEWAVRFAATTDEQWKRLAAKVRQEIVDGNTTDLDDIFPASVSEQ